MTAHNYANLRRITFYFHHCAISYQGDDRDVSHFIDHRSLELTIPDLVLSLLSQRFITMSHVCK